MVQEELSVVQCLKAEELVADLLESEKPPRPVTNHNEEVEIRRPESTGAAFQQQTELITEFIRQG